jgi:uncharacterized membrane protein YsdA (DUF1294 family)
MSGHVFAMTAIVAVYFSMSCIAFVMVGVDKAAAVGRRRRTSETRLHVLSLAGGWPGALLAHGVFRHKTQKRSFQYAFRTMAAMNCMLLGGMLFVLIR